MSSDSSKIRFCQNCGGSLVLKAVKGEDRERLYCHDCQLVVYENPNILVACIATWQDRVLWIKRGIEPQKGLWSVPTGFMEKGETPEEAIVRELYEETRADVEPASLVLYMVGSLPDISEVHLVYRAELRSPHFECTEEATDIALLDEKSVPWEDTAYPDVMDVMRTFYAEHETKEYGIYYCRYQNGSLHFIPINS